MCVGVVFFVGVVRVLSAVREVLVSGHFDFCGLEVLLESCLTGWSWSVNAWCVCCWFGGVTVMLYSSESRLSCFDPWNSVFFSLFVG